MTDSPAPENEDRSSLSELPPPGGVDIISGTGFGIHGSFDEEPEDPSAWRRSRFWRIVFRITGNASNNESAIRSTRAR